MYVEQRSSVGAPLLFIHGWGMHGGMWGEVLTRLADAHRVLAVDLPGHGFSAGSGMRNVGCEGAGFATCYDPLSIRHLDALVDELSAQFPEPLTVCGWSLGGQIAQRWAMRHPDQVSRLVLVSSTPCFVQKTNWLCAMAPDVLAAFAAALEQDYAATQRRFLTLQMRGGERERELLAALRSSLVARGEPDVAALQCGLEMLRDVDLRSYLPAICQQTLLICGDRDTLTPLGASQYMADHIPAAKLAVIRGAAHAPFLSHPDEFVKQLAGFLHE